MIGATTRVSHQIRVRRRLQLDDYFLVLGCMCLTAGTVVGYVSLKLLYFSEDLIYNPSYLLSVLFDPNSDISSRTVQKLLYAYPPLLWTTIFAVKFAYLAFLRQLIDRVERLVIYWRVVVGMTVFSFPICIILSAMICVKLGVEAGQ